MKGFLNYLNYFALKVILLNILHTVAIYLNIYIYIYIYILHVMVIHGYYTFLCCKKNQISLWYKILQNVFLAPD